MKPTMAGGRWVIGRNFKLVGGDGIGHGRGRMAERTREVAQDFWHEHGWSAYHTGAVAFPSREEAPKHIEENTAMLE